MNKIFLTGRVTKDVVLNESNNSCFVKFTIAAKDEDRLKDTDFINCIIWNEAAKNFKKIVKKGSYINVIGTLKNRSYTSNDVTKYYSEVLVKSFEIVCSPKNDTNVGGDLINLDTNQFYDDPFS